MSLVKDDYVAKNYYKILDCLAVAEDHILISLAQKLSSVQIVSAGELRKVEDGTTKRKKVIREFFCPHVYTLSLEYQFFRQKSFSTAAFEANMGKLLINI